MSDIKRITPGEALKLAKKEQRGNLKVFIGYAPGVGKTYSMLSEANRKLKRGCDIVIGYLETHGRENTMGQIGRLETIPRKLIEYNSKSLQEMDTDAIIKRNPKTVLVDEFAHTNVPGSKYTKRYEDVEEMLSNGINVVTTLNIQHLESLNDVVFQITGVRVNETIPDKVLENADEVVVVDITPTALQNRLERGNIYKSENIERALKNFFRKGNLNALREIALRQTADDVDEELEEYMKEHGIKDTWGTVERIMVCISPSPSARKLIRRGARRAKRYKCEWIVVNINSTRRFSQNTTDRDREMLENYQKLAKQLGAEFVSLTGKSVSKTLAQFAGDRHITQIIIGHSRRTFWQKFLRGSTVNKLLDLTKDIEIHIIPN